MGCSRGVGEHVPDLNPEFFCLNRCLQTAIQVISRMFHLLSPFFVCSPAVTPVLFQMHMQTSRPSFLFRHARLAISYRAHIQFCYHCGADFEVRFTFPR
jgi:hypothetical protein